ncbi:conserved hypothetical protein [Beutenbergia cavernae DSM 12333]|uniref:Secreted protein n=1 Tax=Beutenbergia cavernae (strain ATCC BAA-8 / DSM 12333 / CCUG 43141 / JCM 11478 / NBRC 16432 / NCIMB 13614 / HKI 0122) TaxID=471853 RepID=C5C164_BEUC1|nr:DUF5719 family protein [Beutenbergia cavernae]ACQ79468.1 conserved hypothetical protein [Beutenbergia cavernae DSM 12333]
MATPPVTSRIGPRLRTALRRLGATSSALVVLAGVAAVTAIGTADDAGPGEVVPPTRVDVPPSELALVCPGPPRLATADLGGDITYDPEFDAAPAQTQVRQDGLTLRRDDEDAPAAGTIGPLAPDGGTALDAGGDAAVASVADVAGAGVVRADPVGDRSAFGVGATLARTDAGDLRGLVAAPCLPASSTVWLVGGSTALGASTRLVLANPGTTPATVTVTAWGATGPLAMERASGLLVAPGEETAILLEAVATGEERIAVRVDAAGGRVSATLQESQLRGLVAGGTDLVSAAADPATSLLVPGITLAETEVDDPEPSVLRVLNPGDERARVTLRLLGADGENVVPGAQDQVLEPGTVTDVSLAGLPAGWYTAELTSDVPVTAGASLVRVGEPGEDDPDQPVVERAWVAAVDPVTSGAVVADTGGDVVEAARLVVGNPGAEAVTVSVTGYGRDGGTTDPVDLTVAARSSETLDVADLGEGVLGVRLASPSAVSGAMLLSAEPGDGTMFSILPVTPDPDQRQSVDVRLGPG